MYCYIALWVPSVPIVTARPMTTLLLFGHTGTAKLVMHQTQTFIGTPVFMAPEILNMGAYTMQADVWSIGACDSFV
eukprot:9073402-Pyramimonas_sp.AAC.1